jgi:hypothetical protein
MATTTNYGWDTPDDTDLVKDGAAAIRTLGSSIDTTTKALNPSTTLGDVEYRSATANTNTRLGIGTTGQVLTVSGGVPTWAAPSGGAGNMVEIATGTLSGASVVVSGLSTYTDILVRIQSTTNNTAAGIAFLRLNATSSNHDTFGHRYNGSSFSRFVASNFTDFYLSNEEYIRTDTTNVFTAKLTNCKNPGFTDVDIKSSFNANAAGSQGFYDAKGIFTSSAAVSSITIRNSGGTWSAGTYTVWGA